MPRPEPTPLPPMNEWLTYDYWRESHERVKQFWYVSFCLMMSSVQDRLTGLALREAGNLNWATTAFYYSAVHAGRIACFLCCGDYPKGHLELAAMLAGTASDTRPIKVNWLKEFRTYLEGDEATRTVKIMKGAAADLNARMKEAIEARFPTNQDLFRRFSQIPELFRNLRNDCNYEALLVAHERNHSRVTQGFEDLVGAAEAASKIALDTATSLYMENLRTACCFGADRQQFIDAHRTYVCGRLERCLTEKFEQSPAALNGLRAVLKSLSVEGAEGPLPSVDQVKHFLAPIDYEVFDEKRGLMVRWAEDIDSLKKAIA